MPSYFDAEKLDCIFKNESKQILHSILAFSALSLFYFYVSGLHAFFVIFIIGAMQISILCISKYMIIPFNNIRLNAAYITITTVLSIFTGCVFISFYLDGRYLEFSILTISFILYVIYRARIAIGLIVK